MYALTSLIGMRKKMCSCGGHASASPSSSQIRMLEKEAVRFSGTASINN